jgi:hypothetical protein
MRNLILGILIGVVATRMYFAGQTLAWYVWALFAVGSAAVVFGFDILFGSFEEHQKRAGWMGFGMTAGAGAILLVMAWLIGSA